MPAQAHLSARSPDVGRAAGRAVRRLPNRRPNALPRRGQECRPNRSRGLRPYGSMPPNVSSAGRPSHGRSGAGSFAHRKLRLVEARAGNHEFRFRSSVPRTHRKIERSEERKTAAETAPLRAARVTAMLPPRAELYRRDLVGIVVAAGPRHRTRGPVGHEEKKPLIVGTFGAVDPCDIGPCIRCEPHIGPGRIFGDRRRRPFARLLIRYARRHVSGHRSRSRVECPLCNRCAGRRSLRAHPFGLRAAL